MRWKYVEFGDKWVGEQLVFRGSFTYDRTENDGSEMTCHTFILC